MSNLPEPVRVSPLIKLVRYSLLIAGIFYGAAKKKAFQMLEASREPERQRLKAQKQIKLAQEKQAAAERDLAEIIAIFTPKPQFQNINKNICVENEILRTESPDKEEVIVNVERDFDSADIGVSPALSSLVPHEDIKDDVDNIQTDIDDKDELENVQKYFSRDEMEDTQSYDSYSISIIDEDMEDETQNVEIYGDNDEADNVQTYVGNDEVENVQTYDADDEMEKVQTYFASDEMGDNIETYVTSDEPQNVSTENAGADEINGIEENIDERESIPKDERASIPKDELDNLPLIHSVDPIDATEPKFEATEATEDFEANEETNEAARDYFIQTFPDGVPYSEADQKKDTYFYPKDG